MMTVLCYALPAYAVGILSFFLALRAIDPVTWHDDLKDAIGWPIMVFMVVGLLLMSLYAAIDRRLRSDGV